jgi:hypothetical protein
LALGDLEARKKWLGQKWKNITKGLLAILIWIALYAFVQWYRTVGWLGYMSVAIPIAIVSWLASRVSKQAREFLTKGLPETFGQVFDIYEDKMDWVVYFILVLIYGGIIYFILFAPYAVLCHLALRQYGRW